MKVGYNKNPQYCLVGGYIGAPEEWGRFRDTWEAVVKTCNVENFHARDFFSGSHGLYKGWTQAQKDTFLVDLINVIHAHDLLPIGCAVHVPEFMRFTTGERRALTGAVWLLKKRGLEHLVSLMSHTLLR